MIVVKLTALVAKDFFIAAFSKFHHCAKKRDAVNSPVHRGK
jgi:hypothetical protein